MQRNVPSVKKLVIVATKVSGGRGGISSSLSGYIDGLEQLGIDYELVQSHQDNRGMLSSWAKAFIVTSKLAFKYRGGQAVFWFHLGPWLSSLRKASLAVIPRLFGCETLAHIHSPTYFGYLSSLSTRLYIKALMMPFTRLVVLTPWWQVYLREMGINKPSIVSPNPNSEAYCQMARQYLDVPRNVNHTDGRVRILSMARMIQGKGIEQVLKAIALLDDKFQLTLAGDGPKLGEFKALAKRLGIEHRVHFTGWIDGADKAELLKKADIFCLPSTYDSFGMVFIEAMAFDLPVVAYGWGPIPDVVTPDVGVATRSDHEQDIADALVYIAQNQAQYSGKGVARVLENYTPQGVCQNILPVLQD